MIIEDLAKSDNNIMRVLKVSELSHSIARTDKGDLNLKLVKGGKADDYRFTLDAIPMEDKANKSLIELFDGILYEIPLIEDKVEPIIASAEVKPETKLEVIKDGEAN